MQTKTPAPASVPDFDTFLRLAAAQAPSAELYDRVRALRTLPGGVPNLHYSTTGARLAAWTHCTYAQRWRRAADAGGAHFPQADGPMPGLSRLPSGLPFGRCLRLFT